MEKYDEIIASAMFKPVTFYGEEISPLTGRLNCESKNVFVALLNKEQSVY
jgi:hypothetical protein